VLLLFDLTHFLCLSWGFFVGRKERKKEGKKKEERRRRKKEEKESFFFSLLIFILPNNKVNIADSSWHLNP